jgi:hypothetical protein
MPFSRRPTRNTKAEAAETGALRQNDQKRANRLFSLSLTHAHPYAFKQGLE